MFIVICRDVTCNVSTTTFANWRTLGNIDQSLYERAYDLIEVPGAKDAADGKMITFGCQLRELYPKAKTVFVCSSDAVMLIPFLDEDALYP